MTTATPTNTNTTSTRWIVVGGGTAGCVVAARLSDRPSNDVLLLEAGPDTGGGARLPAPGDVELHDPDLVVTHRVSRRDGTGTADYALGRGLGGSSLVNAGVVVDPGGWSGGHDLPMVTVERPGLLGSAVLEATSDAAPVALIGRHGKRVTVAEATLRPVEQRPNLAVRCGVTVASVEIDGRRCLGVRTTDGEQIDADRTVVCAGPVSTPALLLRSGVDNVAVGEGLQDHVGVLIPFDLREPADDDVPTIGVTVERPGRQLVVLERWAGRDDAGAILAGHLAVVGTGNVRVPDPDGEPTVELRQLAHRADRDGLARVVGEALALLDSEPVRPLVGALHLDDRVRGSDLGRWVDEQATLSGYHHLAGSCRIGTALDERGWLLGYEHLAVCDASALPGVPPRNPYLAVVMLAERLSAAWAA